VKAASVKPCWARQDWCRLSFILPDSVMVFAFDPDAWQRVLLTALVLKVAVPFLQRGSSSANRLAPVPMHCPSIFCKQWHRQIKDKQSTHVRE
jgi:hypothetical protein